jgi:hypothetical protein
MVDDGRWTLNWKTELFDDVSLMVLTSLRFAAWKNRGGLDAGESSPAS